MSEAGPPPSLPPAEDFTSATPATIPNPLAGRLCVAAAALMWSSSGFFAKNPIFDSWPSDERGVLLAFWRALFAGLLILPAVRRPHWSGKLLPMAGCFAVMNVTFLSAMSLTTAANAIWLQNTAPWWIFGIGTLVLRDPVNRRDLFTLVPGALGIGLILFHEAGSESHWGVVWGLLAALSYAGVVIFFRNLRGEDTFWLVSINHLVTAAVIAPFVLWRGLWPSGWQWPLLAGFGFFQMALPYTLFGRGLRLISAQEAAAIGLLEPILSPFWAFLVRGEKPGGWTIAGAAMILLGLVLRYAWPKTGR
ncbi:MAG TPA: DMT family transporter [Pirellulales bacterium]|jgi:drug/metabolite transporter (DMT)-like permease|nr:DMT family transporter [Pirellulales bacterium]